MLFCRALATFSSVSMRNSSLVLVAKIAPSISETRSRWIRQTCSMLAHDTRPTKDDHFSLSDAIIRADGDLESAELKIEQELLERFLAKYDENHEIWKLIGVINTNWVSEEDRNQDPLHAGSVYKNLGVLVENCKYLLNEIPFAATQDEAKELIEDSIRTQDLA
ncbi:unnamed protein product, partial [Caenorhabditis brenneri]